MIRRSAIGRILFQAAIAVAFCAGTAVQADTILATQTYIAGAQQSFFPGGFSKVKFYPAHSVSGSNLIEVGAAGSPWFQHGGSGSLTFSSSSTNWSLFEAAVTDGQDDSLRLVGEVRNASETSLASITRFRDESQVFPGDSDLIGYDLTRITLSVSNVRFYYDIDNWQHIEATLQWRFWGDPIPESATAALLGVGAVALVRRRKPQRSPAPSLANPPRRTWRG